MGAKPQVDKVGMGRFDRVMKIALQQTADIFERFFSNSSACGIRLRWISKHEKRASLIFVDALPFGDQKVLSHGWAEEYHLNLWQ